MINETISCDKLSLADFSRHQIRSATRAAEGIPYQRTPHFHADLHYLDKNFEVRFNELYSQLTNEPRSLFFLEFDNCTIFGQGSVLTSRNVLIFDSAAEFLNHGQAPQGATIEHGVVNITKMAGSMKLAGRSILVKRPWYRNHGHWLVDLMPILPMADRAGLALDNIVFGDVPQGHTRSMMLQVKEHFYPSANVIFAGDDEVIECESLIYIMPVHVPPLWKHPLALEMTDFVARKLFPPSDGKRFSKIYISRAGAASRRVVNEVEVSEYLNANGFEILHPEKMTVAEQIAAFSQAEIIVGVKGAALTNCIFCSRDTHVIVLTPSRFVDPFFWDIVTQRQARYSEIYCAEASATGVMGPADADITVEVSRLGFALKALMP